MKKNLMVLFTYKYPFQPPTEQFLDIEMPFWKNEELDIVFCPIARNIDLDSGYEIIRDKRICVKPIKRGSIILEGVTGFSKFISSLKYYTKDLSVIFGSTDKESKLNKLKKNTQIYCQAGAIFNEIKLTLNNLNLSEYDSIFLYSYWLNPTAVAMCWYREFIKRNFKSSVYCIARAHGYGDLYQKNMGEFRPGYSILKNNLDNIFTISQDGLDHLKRQGFNQVELSRLGVSTPYGCNPEVDRENLIVSCSVVNQNKRVGLIAKAIAKASRENRIKWVHFGDGPELSNLQEWCSYNMPEDVEWKLNGRTDNQDILRYYFEKCPALFINVSLVEGIPVSIMEAFSMGIPAIATDVGATREIVIDNKTGFLVDKNISTDDLASVITRFCNLKTEEQKRFRKNAFEVWKDSYSLDNFERFVKLVTTSGERK